MTEQYCPYCGKLMRNPFGMMFYCEDDCDKKQTTVEGEATQAHAEGGWFPLSGFKLIDTPPGLSSTIKNDTGKRLLLRGLCSWKGYDIHSMVQRVNNFRFKRYPYPKHEGSFYVGTNRGFGMFFWHYDYQSKNTGYGGAEFTLQMTGGNTRTIKGPWSPRASAVNLVAPEEYKMVEVMITNHASAKDRFVRAHITLPFAAYLAKQLNLSIYKTEFLGEPYYVVGK